MKTRALIVITALAVGACSDEGPLSPDIRASDGHAAPTLSVLTWNVYVGSRLETLLLVNDPNLIPFEVANIVGQVVENDFAQRADAIAAQVARTHPDVISLQEISLFRTQSPGDFLVGNPVSAETLFLDYLALLGEAFADRGLRYKVASVSENFDIELPMVNFSTGGLDDVRLTDSDVILVRRGVSYGNAADGNFAAALPLNVGGMTLSKPSGWASVDVRRGAKSVRIVNTHLEAADIAPGIVDPNLAALQAAQLAELVEIVDGSPIPVLLMGDLNSAADGSSTATYADLLAEGFLDAWTFGANGSGYTSNQAPDLRNGASQLFHRIDYVLARVQRGERATEFPGAVITERVGEEQADRTVDGLWPSDHAGVLAMIELGGDR